MSEGMKNWWKAALVRAARTGAQVTVALIGAGMVSVFEVDWIHTLGVCATSMALSLLTSVINLPEHSQSQNESGLEIPDGGEGTD